METKSLDVMMSLPQTNYRLKMGLTIDSSVYIQTNFTCVYSMKRRVLYCSRNIIQVLFWLTEQ